MTRQTGDAAPVQRDVTILRPHARRWHERWAGSYDARAVLAARTRDELLERMDLTTLQPGRVLDAGAGTGIASLALARRYPKARVVAVDHAPGMCRRARRRRTWRMRFDVVQADVTALPLRDASMDLVFANLVLQDCHPADPVLKEVRRVLASGGLFAFATLGPDTLIELRSAWREVDDLEHVHPFVDMHDLGEALIRAGFRDPVLDVERYVLTYPDWPGLVSELRALGGASALSSRRRGLTGAGRLAALEAAYERHRREGQLPVTCEVVFGHAWTVGRPPAAAGEEDGEVRIPVAGIGRSRRPR